MHDGHVRASQGIKDLPSEPVRILLASFTNPKTRIKINKDVSLRGKRYLALADLHTLTCLL
jgi:hypothetical protein